jgi:hypothetical protein
MDARQHLRRRMQQRGHSRESGMGVGVDQRRYRAAGGMTALEDDRAKSRLAEFIEQCGIGQESDGIRPAIKAGDAADADFGIASELAAETDRELTQPE